MTLAKVEHALGLIRVYLVEQAARAYGFGDREQDLAEAVATCIRQVNESGDAPPDRYRALAPDALRRAIRFVNRNLASKLLWCEIAKAVDMEPFAFGRGFKLATGMTPHQYIIRCRLRRAMRMLAQDELSLTEISLDVGCSCQSHLTTLFRKHLGTTPGAFRASARKCLPPASSQRFERHMPLPQTTLPL